VTRVIVKIITYTPPPPGARRGRSVLTYFVSGRREAHTLSPQVCSAGLAVQSAALYGPPPCGPDGQWAYFFSRPRLPGLLPPPPAASARVSLPAAGLAPCLLRCRAASREPDAFPNDELGPRKSRARGHAPHRAVPPTVMKTRLGSAWDRRRANGDEPHPSSSGAWPAQGTARNKKASLSWETVTRFSAAGLPLPAVRSTPTGAAPTAPIAETANAGSPGPRPCGRRTRRPPGPRGRLDKPPRSLFAPAFHQRGGRLGWSESQEVLFLSPPACESRPGPPTCWVRHKALACARPSPGRSPGYFGSALPPATTAKDGALSGTSAGSLART